MSLPGTSNPFALFLPRLSRFAAIFAAAAALLALIGWSFDIEVLKQLVPGRKAMNPVSAICFLLLSLSLWLQDTEPSPQIPRDSRRLVRLLCGRGAAIIVLLVALVRLIDYRFGQNIGIDGLIFRARISGNVMAYSSASALLLMGSALFLLDISYGGRQFHASTALTFAAASIALFSLTEYLYSAITLNTVAGRIPMALNSSIVFLLLGVGTLCARPDRQPIRIAISSTLGGTVARRLIPPAFLVPLLLGWLWAHGRTRNFYGDQTGLSLFVLATIIAFNLFTWWCAHILRKTDLRQQQAEQETRQSEERYRAIMEQSAEGIYLVDLETKNIIECNPALERLLGFPRGTGRTKTVFDLVDDTPERVENRLRMLIEAEGALHGEREYRRSDGTPVEVQSSASVIAYGGRHVACTVVHDISARKKAERDLLEKHRQLQQALDQLKLTQSQLVQAEKLASLGQMVAGVAHEINNPLSFVSNNVAVIQRDIAAVMDLLKLYRESDPLLAQQRPELAQAINELAERVDLAFTTDNLKELTSSSRDGLKRIQQIVKDLRDFARLDQADIHDADLNAGIESTMNIIAGLAKKRHVTIEKKLEQIPLVTCQLAKINQVIMNLLSNAIDASSEGTKVLIHTSASDHTVNIEVSDSGTGIPPAIRERIFDPFFTTKPPGSGTGLGLSISYGIIKDHGGTIEVDSALGKGSTFTVRLPRARKDDKVSG